MYFIPNKISKEMSASFFRTVLNWSRTALLPVWTIKRVPVFQVLPSRSQASQSQTHTWTHMRYDTLLLLLDLKEKSLLKHLISTPAEAYDDPMMRQALPRWTKKRTHTHAQCPQCCHTLSANTAVSVWWYFELGAATWRENGFQEAKAQWIQRDTVWEQ